jgi:hypothetical protein
MGALQRPLLSKKKLPCIDEVEVRRSRPPTLAGVLVLNGSVKRALVADAIRSIAAGEYKWGEFEELWDVLFDPESIRQLKILHEQFQPQYCLTSDWTALMDRTAMLNVLRLSGLGFVANNLHARWETGSAHKQSHFVYAIETWLGINPDHNSLWAALGSELRESVQQNLPATYAEFTVLCCRDVGLTNFETERLQKAFLNRLQTSTSD